MERLISLSEFIDNLDYETYAEDEMNRLCVYHQFLKQALMLGMFVPCDVNGDILKEPRREYYDSMTGWNCPEDAYNYENKLSIYKEAETRVLFEVHDISEHHSPHLIKIGYDDEKYLFSYNVGSKLFLTTANKVEDLVKYNLVLTESAKKQIGL